MKKYFKIVSFILLVMICFGCTNTSIECKKESETSYSANDVGIIGNLSSSKYNYNSILVYIWGNYVAQIFNDKLDHLPKYDFDAVIESNGKYYKRTFSGIKLKDLFDNQKITYNNTTIKFQGQHQKSITIEGDSIDDNSFLIFKINGKDIEINDDINYLTYINVKESTANWIYGLSTIEVVNK